MKSEVQSLRLFTSPEGGGFFQAHPSQLWQRGLKILMRWNKEHDQRYRYLIQRIRRKAVTSSIRERFRIVVDQSGFEAVYVLYRADKTATRNKASILDNSPTARYTESIEKTADREE